MISYDSIIDLFEYKIDIVICIGELDDFNLYVK